MTDRPMKERPLLFSAPMIRAILEGRKTVTRRILKPQPPAIEQVRERTGAGFSIFSDHHFPPNHFRVGGEVGVVRDLMGSAYPKNHGWTCPYGQPGDRLWVRETWARLDDPTEKQNAEMAPPDAKAMYRADRSYFVEPCRWRPSIFMPRWASRITLEVTGVRVERLQDISEEDAKAEGVDLATLDGLGDQPIACDPRIRTKATHPHTLAFAMLWDSINGERAPWSSNPWLWRIEFRRGER